MRKTMMWFAGLLCFINLESRSLFIQQDSISEDDQKALLYLIEEQKMARDVCALLGEKHGVKLFTSYSQKAQAQMVRLEELYKTYKPEYQLDKTPGTYVNLKIQDLYQYYVSEGVVSLNEGFRAGAKIADASIYGIENIMSGTQNTKLHGVYGIVRCGSGNQLRSFVNMLVGNGEMFMPEYITMKHYRDIMHSADEVCGQAI